MANLVFPPDGPQEMARMIFTQVKEEVEHIYSSFYLAAKNSFIHWFAKFLGKYNLSLNEYGKIRAAMYYSWSDSPDLTAEEASEIFEEADPDELDTAALEAVVLEYADLTMEDWFAILDEDAKCSISSTYLPDRASIQAWTSSHYATNSG